MTKETDKVEIIAATMWEALDPKGLARGNFPWKDLSAEGKHQWRIQAKAAIDKMEELSRDEVIWTP